jgi:hypothetical protein
LGSKDGSKTKKRLKVYGRIEDIREKEVSVAEAQNRAIWMRMTNTLHNGKKKTHTHTHLKRINLIKIELTI